MYVHFSHSIACVEAFKGVKAEGGARYVKGFRSTPSVADLSADLDPTPRNLKVALEGSLRTG